MNRSIVVFLAASGLAGLLFFYLPQIDIWMAGLFYTPGEGFVLDGSHAVEWLRRVMAWSTTLLVMVALAILVTNIVRRYLLKKETPFFASTRSVIYVLLALGLGPGLLVNAVLKKYSGRARPHQVVAFGGNKQFTQAFAPSDQCTVNCSFVSGESAMGFFGLTFVFVARRRRKAIATASILLGLLLGFVRMGQGAHFFSDVIFSGVFTFLVSYLLYLLIIGDGKKESV
jgi:lipid A 4'-phosphatase